MTCPSRKETEIKVLPLPGGNTFSVGTVPGSCHAPRGNVLFPELVRACFELEATLMPQRPPSSTIAINRHAQFKPHRLAAELQSREQVV